MKNTKKISFKKIVLLIFTVILILFGSFCIYSSFYYKAVDCDKYLESNDITVKEEKDYYYFKASSSTTALIFYPGGKVEAEAYAPLMYEFAENGVSCFLFKMPFNLAMFGSARANEIFNNSNYSFTKYYIGGHSLGGVFASEYAYNNMDKISGVLLLGSYTTKDFSSSTLKFISIYGELDGIMNQEKYDECKVNLPTSFTIEEIIEGGNHSNFGSYGLQKNDNEPKITSKEQIKKTVEIFNKYK